MRGLVAAAVLVMTVGCASSQPTTATSPSPVGSPTPGEAQVTAVTFSCRLPVLTVGKPLYGWTGGFIQFPAATYLSDPAGVLNSIGDGEIGTAAKPSLYGYAQVGLPFYDLALKRWLPTGAGQSAPNGTSYAFITPSLGGTGQFLQVVTVATGGMRSWRVNPPPQGEGQQWTVADYDGRFVYFLATQIDQFPAGVWRFDSANGSLQQLLPVSAGHVLHVENRVAWVGRVDPRDPSPPKPGKGEAFDTIASVNLLTGAQTTWIYRPGQSVIFWGLDSSNHPVVMVTSGPDFGAILPVVLIDVPGGDGIAIPAGFLPLGLMEADAGRLWFGGPNGIYYWTLATGLLKVYAFKPDPSSPDPQVLAPVGHCV